MDGSHSSSSSIREPGGGGQRTDLNSNEVSRGVSVSFPRKFECQVLLVALVGVTILQHWTELRVG